MENLSLLFEDIFYLSVRERLVVSLILSSSCDTKAHAESVHDVFIQAFCAPQVTTKSKYAVGDVLKIF